MFDLDDEDDDYIADKDYAEDQKRYITKEEAKPNSEYFTQQSECPNCGSYNTGQSTYSDFCNSCDWFQSY